MAFSYHFGHFFGYFRSFLALATHLNFASVTQNFVPFFRCFGLVFLSGNLWPLFSLFCWDIFHGYYYAYFSYENMESFIHIIVFANINIRTISKICFSHFFDHKFLFLIFRCFGLVFLSSNLWPLFSLFCWDIFYGYLLCFFPSKWSGCAILQKKTSQTNIK